MNTNLPSKQHQKLQQSYVKQCINTFVAKIKFTQLTKHILFVVPISLFISACSSTNNSLTNTSEINSSELRYQELNRITQQAQQCKTQGNNIVNSASANQSLPQYLLAAKHFRSCSETVVTNSPSTFDELGSLELNSPNASSYVSNDASNNTVNKVKQYKTLAMQLYVASVMNFIKAGELNDAANMVTKFKQAFPKQDFYFANYTSFIDTTEALLDPSNITPQTLATLNISSSLRQELLRKQYWLQH